MSARKLRVIHVGLGPMGLAVARCLREHPSLDLVAAVDRSDTLAGHPLDELLTAKSAEAQPLSNGSRSQRRSGSHAYISGQPRARPGNRLIVRPSLEDTLDSCLADVVVLTTVSSLAACTPAILQITGAGFHCVSSCEELAYPWHTKPDLARQIDQTARRTGVAVLGTGVNPGFLMDYLPIVASMICPVVESVEVRRVQNASARRLPFQRKIGAGLTPDHFRAKVRTGEFGHVGLKESAWLLGDGMGWRLSEVRESISPVLAESRLDGPDGIVLPGQVRGIRQVLEGRDSTRQRLRMEFVAALEQESPQDSIEFESQPPLKIIIPGATHGDSATAAILTHAAAGITRLEPGLRTMLELCPLRGRGS